MPLFRHRRTGRVVEASGSRTQLYQPPRWEQLDAASELADLDVLQKSQSASRIAQAKANQVPTGTVAEVLEWVGDDPDRRNAALEAEEQGRRRKGILDALS